MDDKSFLTLHLYGLLLKTGNFVQIVHGAWEWGGVSGRGDCQLKPVRVRVKRDRGSKSGR